MKTFRQFIISLMLVAGIGGLSVSADAGMFQDYPGEAEEAFYTQEEHN